MRTIQKVAVLGAGTMGARIAAHFANAGIPSVLLDIVLPNQPNRNAAALKGIENAAKQRPGGFFVNEAAALITPGNFEDDLRKGRRLRLDHRSRRRESRNQARPVAEGRGAPQTRAPSSPPTPAAFRCTKSPKDFPPSFRQHFLGTHFFNPPRYMHLVELIPLPDTSHEVMEFVSTFCDRRLGKGVVPCKDTPNFIANRIGSFFGATVQKTPSKATTQSKKSTSSPAL